MKLGIVGHGFVGSAVNQGFTKNVNKYIVDPKYYSSNTIESLIQFKPNATFVAVPTPQLETGECNTDILQEVLQKLNKYKGHLVIVKSTVPAYKLQAIQEQCVDLKIVYNPEFLTEKNHVEDFRNPPMTNQKKDLMEIETSAESKTDLAMVFLRSNPTYAFKLHSIQSYFKVSQYDAKQAMKKKRQLRRYETK